MRRISLKELQRLRLRRSRMVVYWEGMVVVTTTPLGTRMNEKGGGLTEREGWIVERDGSRKEPVAETNVNDRFVLNGWFFGGEVGPRVGEKRILLILSWVKIFNIPFIEDLIVVIYLAYDNQVSFCWLFILSTYLYLYFRIIICYLISFSI